MHEPTATPILRAWAVYHDAFDVVVVHQAESRGRAIAKALAQALEAGYATVRFTDYRAKRAARFDGQVDPANRRHSLGYHGRSYGLWGDFQGYDNYGCLNDCRGQPRAVYEALGAKA